MQDSDRSKLFVGGISWTTTENNLRQHFSKYGTVVSSVIAKDGVSGNPRGFAFVVFSEPSAVDKALPDTHEILGRTVEVKKAIPRSEQVQKESRNGKGVIRNSRTNGRSNEQFSTKKIFVGGLPANLTEEEFRGYFERFGFITDVVVMHDNVTHKPRGFGFITFSSEDSVEQVMQKNFHELCGKLVEVKRAVPKDGSSSHNSGSGNDSLFQNYQHIGYPPYSLRVEVFPSYGPIAGYPYQAGFGYPAGAYSGVVYGAAPFPTGGPLSPFPYGVASAYPSYLNGGFSGYMGSGVYLKSGQIGDGGAQGISGSNNR